MKFIGELFGTRVYGDSIKKFMVSVQKNDQRCVLQKVSSMTNEEYDSVVKVINNVVSLPYHVEHRELEPVASRVQQSMQLE